ncbi:tetratricopeptide repeat protein [bacterium]|nr:tetratricopeptide repeat protein [bacterium]
MSMHRGRIATFIGLILMVALVTGCQSTYVRSAKIYMQQNDPDNAKKVLQEGAEVNPADAELWYILGKVNAELEMWDDMNVAFAKAQELTDAYNDDIKNTRYEAWRREFNAAVTPFNEHNYERALERFQTALKIQPNDKETLKRIGLCYLQMEDYENAESYLQDAVHDPATGNDVSTLYNILMIYRTEERNEDVINMVDQIMVVGGDSLEAARKLDVIQAKALALQQLDRNDDAIGVWDMAIETDPDNPDFHYNKAILLHSAEHFEAAAREYLIAIDLNPEDSEARLNAARSLLASQDWATLVKVLEPWLFPNGVEVYDPELKDMNSWLILRAAYDNLEQTDKSEVVNQILINIQKAESQG